MRRALLPLALAMVLGLPGALAQPVAAVDTVGAVESLEAARFDSMVTARAAVIVAQTDSLRQARADARPWYARWAEPALWTAFALALAVGVPVLTLRLADRRLAQRDAALDAATAATRSAARSADEAKRATEALRREVGAHLERASSAVAESERQLAASSALVDRDDRASRFQKVFRESTHRPDPPSAPSVP